MQPQRSWCSLLAICLLAATPWGGAASADTVIDWNNVTLDAVRDTPLNPPMATRLLALVHGAIYEAVNGVDRLYAPYLVTRSAPPGTSAEAAAVYAAHHVLVDQLPGLRADGWDRVVAHTPSGELGRWLPTPPFPAYTSGHSGFSQGSASILALFFGTDEHSFCGESPDPERWPDSLPVVERGWVGFTEAAEEAGQSRIYGGIHWQYDNQASLVLGSALAQHVFTNLLIPLS